MSNLKTKIQWTDATWSPVTGCSKVSPGCAHCYAETVAARFWPTQYPQIPIEKPSDLDATCTFTRDRQFTDVQCHKDRLDQPLRWKKPRRIFVNSMSDLFHEAVPDAFIDRVFDTMALAVRHTFQVLTKRPERMRSLVPTFAAKHTAPDGSGWPLPNVWLGVSVENQHFADERIPLLLQTPAAVRFISAEPLLAAIDLRRVHYENMVEIDALGGTHGVYRPHGGSNARLDWVIVGGESGKDARPFDLAWARSVVAQCKAAGVPVFVKQLGSCITGVDLNGPPYSSPPRREGFLIHWTDRERNTFGLCHRKGGDPSEWSEDLRVREFPVGA